MNKGKQLYQMLKAMQLNAESNKRKGYVFNERELAKLELVNSLLKKVES